MNVFHRIALRSLQINRTRTVVTIVGVVLSTALITGAVTFGLSLLDYAAAGAAKKYGNWHVAFLDVDAAFAEERAHDPAVACTITAENRGYAVLRGGKNPDKPYLCITGFPAETFDALPVTLLSGRLPENETELLVPAHVSSNGGVEFALGDTLSLSVGSRSDGLRALCQSDPYSAGETFEPAAGKNYTVVGICARPAFEPYTAPGYTVIAKAGSTPGAARLSLFLSLEHPRKAHAYAAEAADGHTPVFNNQVLRFFGLSDDPADRLFNALLFSIGGIVIAIVMTGSIFLIYNAFGISLSERMRQIGVLASVGATARQIRNMVRFEGLCIGAIGIPVGICAGLAGIRIVIAVVAENFYSVMYGGVPIALHVSFPALAAAAAVSLATILISAYLPAKKAARTPIMVCIRETSAHKAEATAVKTPALLRRVLGLPGVLAQKNFRRNRKRYRSIVLSLVLSVVLFVSASAFVQNLKQATAKAASFTTYDIGFGTQAMDDATLYRLYDRLKTAKGVTESACQTILQCDCTVPPDALSDAYRAIAGTGETATLSMEVQFFDDAAYERLLESAGLPAAAFSGENGRLPAVAKLLASGKQGEKEIADFDNLFCNASTTVTLPSAVNGAPGRAEERRVAIVCADIVPPDIPPTKEPAAQRAYVLQLLAPASRMEALFPAGTTPSLRVKGMTFSSENPAQSTAEMRAMLQNAHVSSAYLLLDTTEVFEENRNYIFIANVFAYTFIVMISLIAAANVFNTVSTNIKLRRRELAMLRSIGMSARDFNRMMRFECVLYGLSALAVGLPLASASAYLIYLGMFRGGAAEIVFEPPWASIGISVCSVLLVIFVTMTYAVRKIKKENIIDALRDDMT